jgi:hypothetical protein
MRKLRILGVAALGLLFAMTHDSAAQRRGGAVSSGVRGAVVGGMVGGSDGAATGAKVGVVTGATRSAIDRETAARTQYQSTAPYQSTQHSNFNETPAEVLGVNASGTAAKPKGESVIRKDGKPIMGITFPADWNQKTGDKYISAVSADGTAYSMFASLEGITDKEAAGKKVKAGLENYLKDVKYDDPTETKGGATVITGTGKAKKSGVDVVFAAAVFDAGKGQLIGAAFVVDSKIDEYYKETVRGICQTLRRADDLAKN